MSLCDPRGRRATIVVALLALAGVALSGCGFQPLHGSGGPGQGAAARLAQVEIGHLPDRVGQKLRNLLIDRFHDSSRAAETAYRLEISLRATEQKLAIRKDASAERAQLIVTAPFRLMDARTGAPLLTGASRAFITYNVLEEQYGNIAALEYAYDRALTQIADEVTSRAAMTLAKQP